MKKLFALVAIIVFFAIAFSQAEARKRIRIYKPSPYYAPAQQPGDVALVAVPPIAVVFDIARRTSCDPRVAVGTGNGDPGFDPKGPKVGNFLVPAIYRSECGGVRPSWYGW